ncbi:PA0069 family radical SAM protein [Roseibacterium sp. SDUM158016]|uniref:PA0069 family radical SAM protein n=1 Tax=Roseicyclus sediminis TaxID=2980997 RepID=UPI0021D075DA|nr:PA0069 family radical SAM protein [Roseibacterium sp. SDUM158016]MCU4651728.1 PA0069 family radical SAM protein [Roseibacterium sp. SDUM158016]
MHRGFDPSTGRDVAPRGRAARSNEAGRFERHDRVAEADGWEVQDPDAVSPPALRTEVREERPRRAITRNTSPDISFDRSVNPYRGCEHGCIYCFARPSHAYLGLSPGLDFETKLIARPDAPRVLEAELRRPSYRPATLAIGTNTDPYQPIERERRIMRGCLEVLQGFRHPVAVVTKGTLVERDADILGEMGQAGLARLGISVTTLDPDLARRMEPRCPSPARRLRAIERLAHAGCPVRVMVSPLIPGLTDHELEAILQAARDAGAVAASTIPLRLPREVSGLWQDWLGAHYPARVTRVMDKVRDMHGGADYDPAWGSRMTGQGIWADLIRARFRRATRALGLAERLPPLRTDLFAPPLARDGQLSLF